MGLNLCNRLRAALAAALLTVLALPAAAQTDPGIRGGFQNTSGMQQYNALLAFFSTRQIPVFPPTAHPPLLSQNPGDNAPVAPTTKACFLEVINRAGQLQQTCSPC